MHLRRIVAGFVLLGTASAVADGLDGLALVQPGQSRRVSSAAPTPGSNRDNRWIKPGEVFTLAEITGPATITHIWLTFNEARPNWLSAAGSADPSEIVLRMYWDGAEQPAVEAPLGDFFAAGFGLRREIRSTPVQVESGDGYNCYWPMPFHKRARITVTNESDKNLNALYFHVDYLALDAQPADAAYFCAQYRQEFPTRLGQDYLVLDAIGRGHYVGTVLSVRSRSPEWFGEGDDKFYVDGAAAPSMWGTGTEDYFGCAWGMSECSYPSFGCTYMEGGFGELGVRYTMYRWHLADPVRFTKSLRFEIEHKGWLSADETESGKVEGHVEREDDFASVAFWYQIGQPKRFAQLPPARERRFPDLDRVIGGGTLLASARHSPGEIRLQEGYDWTTPGQVFFQPLEPHAGGDRPFLELDFDVLQAELRGLVLRLTHSYDYGRYQVSLDGAKLGEPIDLYRPQIEVHDHLLGSFTLAPGKHTLRLEAVGQNPASTGRFLGVDSIRLRERWKTKRPALKP